MSDISLLSAVKSHIKSTSIVKNKKVYNAIGAYFSTIENIEEVKEYIINPLIETNLEKNVSITKSKGESNIIDYKILFLNQFPAIRNTAYNKLANDIRHLNSLLYYYSKKEHNLLSFKQTHNISSDTCHTISRSIYLDISNLINIIKVSKKEKLILTDDIIKLGRDILKSSLSDEEFSPLEYVMAEAFISLKENNGDIKISSMYPRIKYTGSDTKIIPIKLKNLQTLYFNELSKETNTKIEMLI